MTSASRHSADGSSPVSKPALLVLGLLLLVDLAILAVWLAGRWSNAAAIAASLAWLGLAALWLRLDAVPRTRAARALERLAPAAPIGQALLGGLLAAVFLLPLAWMVAAALRAPGQPIPSHLELLPRQPTLASFEALFSLLQPGRFALNSLVVSGLAVPLAIVTASAAAFGLSQLPPRWRGTLVTISLAAMLVPLLSLWVTRYLVYRSLGLIDSLLALVLPFALGGSPFYVLLLYWSVRRLPTELFDAARLDGCGPLRIWWSVALPLIRPALAPVGIFSFATSWSSFVDPLLFLSSAERFTLPLALHSLQQMHPSTWSLLMAASVLVSAPVLLLFVAAQRVFLYQQGPSAWLEH